MNLTGQRVASLIVLNFMALLLLGCGNITTTSHEFAATPSYATPMPVILESSNPDYAYAQATIDTGQNQLMDLSLKATEASLNISQAANAAALSTQQYNQRQQMELDYQSTIVSLNITQAAATQKFIKQQTKTARDASTAAQNSAAAATRSTYLVNVTQTAQAQAIQDAQASQIAQAVVALQFYPLTATPFAATQAALLMQQYAREQKSFVDRIVSPLIPIVATIFVLLLFILVIVVAYRRYMLIPWPRRLRIGHVNVNPLIMIDGVITDHHLPLHQVIPSIITPVEPLGLPCEKTVSVEIVNASEPPVAHWIAEVEQQLANEGGS